MTTTDTTENIPVTGRAQLLRALDAGRDAFAMQLRYLLMLCQVVKARPLPPEPPSSLNVNDTRLEALVCLSAQLNPQQRDKLFDLIEAVEHEGTRLFLLARAIRDLPDEQAHPFAQTVWENLEHIEDPYLRASALLDIVGFVHEAQGGSSTAPNALLRMVRIAQSLKNTEARLRGMISIAPHLPPQQGTDLLKAILNELARSNNDTLTTKSINTLAPVLPIQLMEATIMLCKTIKAPLERARALTALTPHVLNEFRGKVREDALNAIELIESEDERAEALVALAPYMESASKREYPRALEQALSIAIGMQRRPLRARMLVSLAPHLTSDLQVEAIAAVNSLTNERERATLLTQLAPTLPESMIVASLAVAYTMREQDSRVLALTALASYAPEQVRSQTLLDALASASNLNNHYERVRVLVGLLDLLNPAMRDQTMTNALESARLIENESARARAINLLGAHLNEALLTRALGVARELTNTDHRLSALLGLTPYLPAALHGDAIRDMQACVVATNMDYKRARALASIASLVNSDEVALLDTMAVSLSDPIDRVNVYLALVTHLPPKQRPPLVRKAWELLSNAEVGYDKASAMVTLAAHIAPEDHEALLRLIVPTIEALEDDYDKASAMVILAPLLVGEQSEQTSSITRWDVLVRAMEVALLVPYPGQRIALLERASSLWTQESAPERAYLAWTELAQQMTNLPLAHTVQALGALMPLLMDFGGAQAVTEVAQLLGIR
jgi:hypothetical protein